MVKKICCQLFFCITSVSAIAAPPGPPPTFTPDQTINSQQGPVSTRKGINYFEIEDLPPGIKEEEQRRHQDLISKGYIESTDERLEWVEAIAKVAKPLSEFQGNIKIKLSNLDDTQFSKLKFLGAVHDGPPSSLTRIFSFPDGNVLLLTEWDYVAEGGGMLIPKNRLNESVNGIPAILGIAQSPGGKAVSQLSWVTSKKSYQLIMSGHVRKNGMHKKMMALANSIKD